MQVDLRMHGVGDQSALVVIEGEPCFVARRFDA
jgi:hypothetical protein